MSGTKTLTADFQIKVWDETSFPGTTDWRIWCSGGTGFNELRIRPPGGWDGKSELTIQTREADGSGGTGHLYRFGEDGSLILPQCLKLYGDNGSGDAGTAASLAIKNYNYTAAGTGVWNVYATGTPSGIDTRLVIEPIAPDGTVYTGDISMIVGDPDGTQGVNWHEWRFSKDGKLLLNGFQMLP
jgi:hypothetical protein